MLILIFPSDIWAKKCSVYMAKYGILNWLNGLSYNGTLADV